MRKKDQLKHNRRFDEYKKQRNYVLNLVQKAKNTYFSQLVKDNRDTSSIWKAINSITRKDSKTCDISASNIPPDSFNDHFLFVSTTLLHSLNESSGHDSYICSSSLIDFCREKRGPSRAFHIPLLTAYEVGKLITGLTSKTFMGPDNIPTYLLKLAIPYVVDSLTYIYKLCIQKNVFPKIFKTAKVTPLPKNTDRTDPNNFRPISLLSVLSKPLERHVHRHLSTFMEKHNLFHTLQSGFRSSKQHNTTFHDIFPKGIIVFFGDFFSSDEMIRGLPDVSRLVFYCIRYWLVSECRFVQFSGMTYTYLHSLIFLLACLFVCFLLLFCPSVYVCIGPLPH